MIYKVKDRENISVSSAVVTLTAAKAAATTTVFARIQVQVAAIRVTSDGTDPVPATPIGEIYYPGDFFEAWGYDTMTKLKMIRESVDAKVEVTYMGTGG